MSNVEYLPMGEPVKRKDFPLKFLGDLKINLSNRWAVKGLLPNKGLAVVYGAPSSGKSFLTLSLTLHMATGKEFAGKKVKRGGVVYISAEAGEGFETRAAATCDVMGLKPSDPFALLTVSPDLGKADGDARSLIDQIYENTDRVGWRADCIVVDTVARAAQGVDENSSRDMGQFIANCDLIAAELDALVIAVHHSGKVAENGMRGSSALLGAADSVIAISSDDEGLRTAKIEKQKDGAAGRAFTFRLETITLGQDDDGDDVTTCLVTDVSEITEAKAQPKKSGERISKGLRLFMNAFEAAVNDNGKDCKPFADGPTVRAVDREALRDAFYARFAEAEPSAKSDAKRQAFKRGLSAAQNSGIINSNGDNQNPIFWRVYA